MYLSSFDKFGLSEFLQAIFSSRPASPEKDPTKSEDYVSFTQIDNLIAENFKNDNNTREMSGFKNGNGEKIQIDQDKISQALKLFMDKEDFDFLPSDKKSSPKKNSKSEKKTKNLTEKNEFFEDFKKLDVFFHDVKEKEKELEFVGFQTAKGGILDINQKNLKKAEKLFAEAKEPEITKIQPQNNQDNGLKKKTETNFNDFKGFQTAKGGVLNIREQNLKKAEKLLFDENEENKFNEINENIKILEKNQKPAKLIDKKLNIPMQFDQNKPMKNSPNFHVNLTEKIEIFSENKENFNKNKEKNQKLHEIKETCQNNQEEFQGFKTAKGQTLQVDEKKLLAAELMLSAEKNDGSNLEEITKKNEKKLNLKDPNNDNTGFFGFQTAKGGSITLDQSKLKLAEKLFEDKVENDKKKIEKKQEKLLHPRPGVEEEKRTEKNEKILHPKSNNTKNQKNSDIFLENKGKSILNNDENSKENLNKIIEKTPNVSGKCQKYRFLDFRNKNSSPRLLENGERMIVKSSEKLRIPKPTSKKLYTVGRIVSSAFFSEKPFLKKPAGSPNKKRTIEAFENDEEVICLSTKRSDILIKNHEINLFGKDLQKSPNLIFSLQAKNMLKILNSVKKAVKLSDLSIVQPQNANKNFEMSEFQALNYNFICDCVTFSQNCSEKCMCGGKLIIPSEFFSRLLAEKFPKIKASEVKMNNCLK